MCNFNIINVGDSGPLHLRQVRGRFCGLKNTLIRKDFGRGGAI